MKITIKRESEITIDIPRFFKVKGMENRYYMTVGNESAIMVTDYELSESLILFPKIEGTCIRFIPFIGNGIIQISETEYKTAFLRVSLRLEKMMN